MVPRSGTVSTLYVGTLGLSEGGPGWVEVLEPNFKLYSKPTPVYKFDVVVIYRLSSSLTPLPPPLLPLNYILSTSKIS